MLALCLSRQLGSLARVQWFFFVSFSSSQSFRNHAERKDIRERIEEKDTAEGENSQELHGEGYGSTYICSHCPTNSRADTPDT